MSLAICAALRLGRLISEQRTFESLPVSLLSVVLTASSSGNSFTIDQVVCPCIVRTTAALQRSSEPRNS